MTTANSYTNELIQIKRASLQPMDKFDDLPGVNYYSSGTVVADSQYSTQYRDLNIVLEAYIRTLDNPFTDVASLLADEIETVLHRAPTAPLSTDSVESLLFSGSAAVGEIYIDEIVYAIGEGQTPYCGVVFTGRIRHHIDVGKPSTLLEI